MKDVIQLGTVAQNTESTTPVEFSFKPVNPALCTGLNGKTATITWYGDFDANGLKNSTGKAYRRYRKTDGNECSKQCAYTGDGI